MTLSQLSKWENLTRCHPVPWYLEKANDTEVEVKDSEGNTVYYDDLGGIPDEMPSGEAERIRAGSHALALWLVAWSENPNTL